MLLSDPLLADQALALIQDKHYNAEWALTTQGQILGEQFAAIEDEYLRERGSDVRQVIERVLQVLSGSKQTLELNHDIDVDDHLIVVAHDISPADMIRLRGARFAGFATDLGGATSHTAIVARSLGVPAVVALGHIRALVSDGDWVVVDGANGAVLVNPSRQALEQYRRLQQLYIDERAELSLLKDVPAETLDGIQISLEANIELPDEAELALANGASGIGLFRTEFLFIGRNDLPTEEEQYQAYLNVVTTMQHRPVTIRTLDIGADKTLDGEATVACVRYGIVWRTHNYLPHSCVRYCAPLRMALCES
jgi:phosphotransferase system enzyme I (PtsI)